MKINIRQNISNLLDDHRQLIDSSKTEIFILYPEQGKKLKNIKTGDIYLDYAYVNNEENIKNYIEIE